MSAPGTGTLKVDGNVVATKKMEKTLPMILQWDEVHGIDASPHHNPAAKARRRFIPLASGIFLPLPRIRL